MTNHYLKILTVILLSVASLACDSQSVSTSTLANLARQGSVWDKMADNSKMKTYHMNPRVQYFIKQFSRDDAIKLVKNSEQAAPYIYHIIKMLEERGMPIELAVLPIVESEYRPQATSSVGATGLWQLTSATGRIHGLKQDSGYDGRKDIDAATAAALLHLQYLYEEFDHDWLLALAAYNAGSGRVSKAIRANKKLGKPTDYWSLSLPKETLYFVPKFLAIAHLIRNSRNLGVELAHVPNKPYFTQVKLEAPIDLNTAAKMAELDVAEVKKLNPAHRSNVTHPAGQHKILLPVKHASIFKANMIVKHKAPKIVTPKTKTTKSAPVTTVTRAVEPIHIVTSGDTLHIIASKYRTTVQSIKHKNKLKSDTITKGQRLDI